MCAVAVSEYKNRASSPVMSSMPTAPVELIDPLMPSYICPAPAPLLGATRN